MNKALEQTFNLENTKDGSPTLRIKDTRETMHHSAGAAAETLYIYKSVLDRAFSLKGDLRTCVVGLGLGYIEMAWAMGVTKNQLKVSQLTSFEVELALRESFSQWLKSDEVQVYDRALRALDSGAEANDIKNILRENLLLEGDLLLYRGTAKWNIICYDAFGREFNQKLWSEGWLREFIETHCEEDCIFTTYAYTGSLKKVLLEKGFTLLNRPGFQGKRASTLALRGVFSSEYLPHFCRTF